MDEFTRKDALSCLGAIAILAIIAGLLIASCYVGSNTITGTVLEDGVLQRKGHSYDYFAKVAVDGEATHISISEQVSNVVREGDTCSFTNGAWTRVYDAVECEE